MGWLSDPRNRKLLYALLIVVALVNLPLVHSTWTRAEVARDGVDVTATVVDSRVVGAGDDRRYWVGYRLPERLDAERLTWPAEVEAATWDRVHDGGEIRVRVLPDQPAAAQVDGEVSRRAGLWTTLVVDAVLLALVLLFWRHRRRHRGEEDDPPEDQEASRSW